MYPTVGYGLTSLSKLEAGAQSAGGWAHSSRHRTGPTGHSNKVTTPPLAILIWAYLYFMGQILSELTRVQSGGGFGHKILFFKQPTIIICLMQILQTTNNLPKDTRRFWKSVPMLRYCYEARPWPCYTTDNYYWSQDRATPVSDQWPQLCHHPASIQDLSLPEKI